MNLQITQGYNSDVTAKSTENGYEVERVYYVKNDDTSNDMEMRILTSPLLPKRGDIYSTSFPNIKVKSVEIESPNSNNFTHWTVTVSYETSITTSDGSDNVNLDDPTTHPATIDSTSTLIEKLVHKAYKMGSKDNERTIPVESTTGEPLQLSTVIPVQEKTISVNRRYYNPDWELLSGTINDSSIRIAGTNAEPAHAMLRQIGARNEYDNEGNLYYAITMSFQITGDADGFNTSIVNAGFNMNDGSGGLRKILNKDVTLNSDDVDAEETILEPAKLNPANYVITEVGDIFTLLFQDKRMASWGELPIPQDADGR